MAHKTGQTFRTILSAVGQASLGRQMVIVSVNEAEAKRVMKATVKLANTYLTPDFLTHAMGNKYMMANGGTMTFMGEEEYAAAFDAGVIKPNAVVVHDCDDDPH